MGKILNEGCNYLMTIKISFGNCMDSTLKWILLLLLDYNSECHTTLAHYVWQQCDK